MNLHKRISQRIKSNKNLNTRYGVNTSKSIARVGRERSDEEGELLTPVQIALFISWSHLVNSKTFSSQSKCSNTNLSVITSD